MAFLNMCYNPDMNITDNLDITSNKQYEFIYQDNQMILEYITQHNELSKILDKIVHLAEYRNPNSKCSILLLNESKKNLLSGSAPSLPDYYNEAINGIEIGEKIGSCGSATFKQERVIVEDIDTHENWQPYLALTQKANLHACWSEPIFSSSNEILGSFAIYNDHIKSPNDFELKLISSYAHLAAVAIDKENNNKLIKEKEHQILEHIKKSNEKLKLSEERLSYALHGTSDGLWDWNLKTNEVYYSPRWFTMLGYEANELPKTLQTWENLVYSEDKERTLKLISEYIEGHSDNFETKFRMKHKNGSLIHILSRAKLASDKDGNRLQPLRLVGTHLDITKEINHHIEMEKNILKLQLAQQELQDYLKSSSDFVWEVDVDGKYTKVSDGVYNILGYESSEILGKTPFDFMEKESLKKISQQFKEILKEQREIRALENYNIAKDGSLKCLETSGVPFFNQDGELAGYRGTDRDITALKEYEKSIVNAREEAENANKSKSLFLANMSHEIRTPMTGLLGFIDRLQKSEKDPEKQKQFKTIRSSGETLLSIINDILDFSKIESGKMQVESVPIMVKQLLENTIDVFKQLASAKNINLLNAITDNIPICIFGDETRLKQVLFNLLSNAIKFTSESGNITLQVRLKEERKLLHIAVIDTGVGIAKENLEKIFEAFDQEDNSTTRRFGGTGLGLTISSRLVNLMGGQLYVESKVGQGSKFYFDIPIETCSADIDDESTLEVESVNLDNIKANILVVEDNKTNQLLMGMILDDYNLNYDIANDGAEAVLQFKHNKYDVILMDENMPNMNGIEATKIIRELEEDTDSHIPIIAVTANALVEDRERFLAIGMDDYISKPYTEEDIIQVLKKYLR